MLSDNVRTWARNLSASFRQRPILIAITLLAIALPGSAVQAATLTWDSDTAAGIQAASGNWNSNSWTTTGTALSAWTTSSTAVFTNTSGDGGPWTVSPIVSTTASSLWVYNSGFTLGAGSLTITRNSGSFGTTSNSNPGVSALWIQDGKTFDVGNGAFANFTSGSSFTATIFLNSNGGTGATFNIDSGGTANLDGTGGVNSGLRFSGTGAANIFGTLAITPTSAMSQSIVLQAYATDQTTINVNSGGLIFSNSNAGGGNFGNGSILVSNGAARHGLRSAQRQLGRRRARRAYDKRQLRFVDRATRPAAARST